MFIVDSLAELPLWFLAVVLNGVLMGTGLIGLWVMRRWVLPRLALRYDDAYLAAPIVQSAMRRAI